jgi:hypothetical protein
MIRVFNITAFIYGTLLALFIPISLGASFLVAAAGHVRSFEWTDYLVFAYSIITSIGLFRCRAAFRRDFSISTKLYYLMCLLIMAGMAAALFPIVEAVFINNSMEDLDGPSIGIVALVICINLILLIGLQANKPSSKAGA